MELLWKERDALFEMHCPTGEAAVKREELGAGLGCYPPVLLHLSGAEHKPSTLLCPLL